jgi:hypothetical protein
MADLRTPAERAYDSLKDGSAYTKPIEDAGPWEPIIDIITGPRVHRPYDQKLPDVPFGTLPDGQPIMAEYDVDDTRMGVVNVTRAGWQINADDSGVFGIGTEDDDLELTIAQLRTLGALYADGTIEALYAAAVAWEHGEDAPADDPLTTIFKWIEKDDAPEDTDAIIKVLGGK